MLILPDHYLPQAQQIEATLNGQPLNIRRYSQLDEPCYFIHVSLPEDTPMELWLAIKRKHHTMSYHSLRKTARPSNTNDMVTARVNIRPRYKVTITTFLTAMV